jgi:hypothetical protein
MEGTVLERAERIVRGLPISNIKFCRTESQHCEILYAYGKSGEGNYFGAWVVAEPTFVLRPMEFHKGVTSKQVRQALVTNAEWWLDECAKRGLVRSGAVFGKKY